MPLTRHAESTLESLVDGGSLRAVLESLATICAEKAMHVEEYWQDRTLARRWMKAGRKIDIISTSPVIDDVS